MVEVVQGSAGVFPGCKSSLKNAVWSRQRYGSSAANTSTALSDVHKAPASAISTDHRRQVMGGSKSTPGKTLPRISQSLLRKCYLLRWSHSCLLMLVATAESHMVIGLADAAAAWVDSIPRRGRKTTGPAGGITHPFVKHAFFFMVGWILPSPNRVNRQGNVLSWMNASGLPSKMLLPPPVQIIGRFDFSRFIHFATHLDKHNIYNLERRECPLL